MAIQFDSSSITLEHIRKAHETIAPYIRATPLVPFDYINRKLNADVWLKCELLQRTGSFKIRGAANCVLRNLDQARKRGVVAASAGNHAQGVAAICNLLGISTTIVMPTIASPIKVRNTERWGAKVELVGQVYDEAYDYASRLSQDKGLLFIHPFRDPYVIAGQGTVALELLDSPDFKDAEAVLLPIGGGGLITGCATALRAKRPGIKIYGLSAKNAPANWKAFHQKQLLEEPVSITLADGIATKKADATMLPLLTSLVDDVFCVSEESIAHAISVLGEQAKLLVEGSAAITLAPILENLIPERKVVAVLSGGNIDIPTLSQVLGRGLVEQGRLVRVVITIMDRPGGLNSVTAVLATLGANIQQVFHQRSSLKTQVGHTRIEVELETRGPEHTESVLQALTQKGFQVERDL